MKIQLLLTGNEIMSGHTVDSNSALIAEKLLDLGYPIYRKVTVGDDINVLISEIKHMSADSDVLIVNGGLGPTIDDLTAEALSQATQSPLSLNKQALTHVEDWCQRLNISFNDSGKKQAKLPENITVINNPIGSAVGFYNEYQHCLIICTPGVPSELRAMMDETIAPLICKHFPQQKTPPTIRLQTFGLGESTLQEMVNDEYPDWPQEVELGFRAGIPQLEIKLSISHDHHQPLQKQCYNWLQQKVGDHIVGEKSTKLSETVIELLKRHEERVCCAESCTGGLIATMLTEIPGSSAAFEAGIVSYSNDSKQALLQVSEKLLNQYGAVSEQVVLAMAEGALAQTGADYTMAVSGIAGPEGGSNEKPVGTVCIAWGDKEQIQTVTLHYPMPRIWFQQMVAAMALDLLRRKLLKINEPPNYLARYQKDSI